MRAIAGAIAAVILPAMSALAWPSPSEVCAASVYWLQSGWDKDGRTSGRALVKAQVTAVDASPAAEIEWSWGKTRARIDVSIVEIERTDFQLVSGLEVTADLMLGCDDRTFGHRAPGIEVGTYLRLALWRNSDGNLVITGRVGW